MKELGYIYGKLYGGPDSESLDGQYSRWVNSVFSNGYFNREKFMRRYHMGIKCFYYSFKDRYSMNMNDIERANSFKWAWDIYFSILLGI